MNYAKVVFEQARDALPFPDLHEVAFVDSPAALGRELVEGTLPGRSALRRLVHAEYIHYCVLPAVKVLFGTHTVLPAAHVANGVDLSGLAIADVPQVGPALVDVCFRSTKAWEKQTPDHLAARMALAKAATHGLAKAVLILIEQNTQNWSWWVCSIPDVDTFGATLRVEAEALTEVFGGARTTPLRRAGLPISIEPAYHLQVKADAFIVERAKHRSATMRRGGVISPSEISTTTCDRRIGYALQAVERRATIPTMLYRIFDYGTSTHEVLQRLLTRGLPRLLVEVKIRSDELMLQGSADLMDPDEGACLELKSMTTNQWEPLKDKKPEHEVQGTIYGRAGNKRYPNSVFSYTNKETYDIKEFAGRANDGLWHKVAARCETIVKAHRAGSLLDRTKDKSQCTECPFTWICKPDGKAPDNDPPLLKNLRKHAQERRP